MPIRYRSEPVYCKHCGKLIENAVGNRKYCPECAKIVAAEQQRRNKLSRREGYKYRGELRKEVEEKRARKGPSLSEIMHEANKEGLQYAEYCKKHNLY